MVVIGARGRYSDINQEGSEGVGEVDRVKCSKNRCEEEPIKCGERSSRSVLILEKDLMRSFAHLHTCRVYTPTLTLLYKRNIDASPR